MYFHISCFPDGPPDGANKIESSVPAPGRQYLKCCISTFYFSNLDKRSDSMAPPIESERFDWMNVGAFVIYSNLQPNKRMSFTKYNKNSGKMSWYSGKLKIFKFLCFFIRCFRLILITEFFLIEVNLFLY